MEMAMKKCKKCNRPLKEDEDSMCPACKSKKHSFWKRTSEIVLTVLGIVILRRKL